MKKKIVVEKKKLLKKISVVVEKILWSRKNLVVVENFVGVPGGPEFRSGGGRFLDQILHLKFFDFFGGAGKKIYHVKSDFKKSKNLLKKKILSTEKKFVDEKNFG